jgi:hypothetical protein
MVPVQTRPVPQAVLDYADDLSVTIRDVTGHVRLGARGPQIPDACQGALAEGQFKVDLRGFGVQGLRFRLWRSRKLSPFISRMWTWWVRRSRMAPVRRSDPKTSVHSSNGRFEVMMIEPRS